MVIMNYMNYNEINLCSILFKIKVISDKIIYLGYENLWIIELLNLFRILVLNYQFLQNHLINFCFGRGGIISSFNKFTTLYWRNFILHFPDWLYDLFIGGRIGFFFVARTENMLDFEKLFYLLSSSIVVFDWIYLL